MTIVDIIIVLLALLVAAFGIIYQIRKRKAAKRAGLNACSGCLGCPSESETKNCQ